MKRGLPSNAAGRRAGFTLLELLVVISVIALLIGILLPVLSSARKTTQAMTCANVVRQIGLGHEAYATDHRERYAMAGHHITWGNVDTTLGPPAGTRLPSWMEQIDYYIDVKANAGDEAEPFYSGCPTYPVDSPYHYFLGANAAFRAAGNDYASVVRDRVRFTSAFVMGGDLNRKFGVTDADKDDYTQNCLGWEEFADPAHPDHGQYLEPHHEGGLNVLFADGHAALYTAFDAQRMTFSYDEMTPWVTP